MSGVGERENERAKGWESLDSTINNTAHLQEGRGECQDALDSVQAQGLQRFIGCVRVDACALERVRACVWI